MAKRAAITEFALAETPILEGIEAIGRIVLESRASGLMKILPLPEALKRLIGKLTDKGTEAQDKIDGKRVITVKKAIEIVRKQANQFAEAADVSAVLFPAPGTEGKVLSLAERIALELRNSALRQDKAEIHVVGPHRTRKQS